MCKRMRIIKEIANHPLNILLQYLIRDSGVTWSESIVLVIVGSTTYFWRINPLTRGWWNKMMSIEWDEILMISFVVKY